MQLFKKFTVFIFCFSIINFADAQTVKVKKEFAQINGENLEGYETELEGTLDELNSSFIKFLKNTGKTKQSVDGITITEPTFHGIQYTSPVFAIIKAKEKTASAWIGIDSTEWEQKDAEKINTSLEKMIYEFGVKFYKDKIRLQIDEALQAVLAVQKQQQRLIKENGGLNEKLIKNEKEKTVLERSLEDNKVEHENLLKKIEQNTTAQDSVAVAVEQIKKVVELHKEKQRNVN